MTEFTRKDSSNTSVLSLDYGSDALRRGNRWGVASCMRAAVVFAVIAYLNSTVYLVRPQDTVRLVFWWPLALVIVAFGVWYGIKGLRLDEVRRWAIVGLVTNTLLAAPVVAGTIEAVREIDTAYRYSGGVIIMSNR